MVINTYLSVGPILIQFSDKIEKYLIYHNIIVDPLEQEELYVFSPASYYCFRSHFLAFIIYLPARSLFILSFVLLFVNKSP